MSSVCKNDSRPSLFVGLKEGVDMVTAPPPSPHPHPSCLVDGHGRVQRTGKPLILCSCFFLVHSLFFLLLFNFLQLIVTRWYWSRTAPLPPPSAPGFSHHPPPPSPVSLPPSLPPVNSKTPVTDLRYTDNLNHWVEPYIM